MFRVNTLFVTVLCVLLPLRLASAAEPLDTLIRDALAQTFTATALLTDNEEVTFGFLDFNPNEFLDQNNDQLGSDEALALRSQLRLYSIPFSFEDRDDEGSVNQFGVQLSRLDSGDNGRETSVLALRLKAIRRQSLGSGYYLDAGTSGHVMRFRDSTDYRTPTEQALSSALDGYLANFHAKAWMIEPKLGLRYHHILWGSGWQWYGELNYLYGQTFDTNNPAHQTSMESWHTRLGTRIRVPFRSPWLIGQSLLIRLARTDLGSDVQEPLGVRHYYTTGLGWLINIGNGDSWIENIGLSANITYGGALKGGTLVLLVNEL